MSLCKMVVGVNSPRCGVRDYAQALVAALPPETVRLVEVPTPPGHVFRHRLPALLRARRMVRRAALELSSVRRSSPIRLVHIQYSDFSWNGVRPFEDLYELFTRRTGRPLLVTLHEHPWFRDEHEWDRPRTAADRVFGWLAASGGCVTEADPRAVLLRHAGIHVHHRWQAAVIERCGIPSERLLVLPHPVLPTAGGLPPERIVTQFGLQGKRIMIMTGFLFERKRHDRVLELLPLLPGDVTLCLLGGPHGVASEVYTERLRRRARELQVENRFVITGYLSEPQLAAGIAAATLLLAPYGEVTSSGSILRGLAMAPPVVAANCASFVEMKEDGAGLDCVDAASPSELLAAVRRILDDPAHAAKLRARNRAYAERYSMTRFAAQIAEWYGEVSEE